MQEESTVEWSDCAECGLPAFVVHRFQVPSTDGPVPHAVTVCAAMHRLCSPDAGGDAGGEPHGEAERAVPAPTHWLDAGHEASPWETGAP